MQFQVGDIVQPRYTYWFTDRGVPLPAYGRVSDRTLMFGRDTVRYVVTWFNDDHSRWPTPATQCPFGCYDYELELSPLSLALGDT